MDPDGRYTVYLIVEGNLNSTPVTLVNIYSPNFDCPEFFQIFLNSIPNLGHTNVIIAGDINCILDTNLDKTFSTSLQQSKEINKCFEEFCCELYSSYSSASQATINEFLQESKLTKLDEEVVADLEADFTLDEVKVAIQQFLNSKAPGPDGFGAEFYKAYSSLLAPLIRRMLNHSKELGSLPSSL